MVVRNTDLTALLWGFNETMDVAFSWVLPRSRSSRNGSSKSQELQHRGQVPSNERMGRLGGKCCLLPSKGEAERAGFDASPHQLYDESSVTSALGFTVVRDSYEDKTKCHLKVSRPEQVAQQTLGISLSIQLHHCLVFSNGYRRFALTLQGARAASSVMLSVLSAAPRPLLASRGTTHTPVLAAIHLPPNSPGSLEIQASLFPIGSLAPY